MNSVRIGLIGGSVRFQRFKDAHPHVTNFRSAGQFVVVYDSHRNMAVLEKVKFKFFVKFRQVHRVAARWRQSGGKKGAAGWSVGGAGRANRIE